MFIYLLTYLLTYYLLTYIPTYLLTHSLTYSQPVICFVRDISIRLSYKVEAVKLDSLP